MRLNNVLQSFVIWLDSFNCLEAKILPVHLQKLSCPVVIFTESFDVNFCPLLPVSCMLIDFLLTVKAATLIFIFGCGSAISSAKQR